MLQLTSLYVNQADREREVEAELRNRQALKPVRATTPTEPSATSVSNPRRAPMRARAIGR